MIDEWFESTVKRHCAGKVELFRYCDDAVICCQSEHDAKRIEKALGQRLAKYGLQLNKDKTKLVAFSKWEARQGRKQGAFDFLGFTVYWGRSRKGHAIPKVKTNGKRLRAKLRKVKPWVISVKNRLGLKEIWTRFCTKLRGHIRYYGVSYNLAGIRKFCRAAIRILYKWLNRRSQRKSFDWDKFNLFMKRNPPPRTKIYHSLILTT